MLWFSAGCWPSFALGDCDADCVGVIALVGKHNVTLAEDLEQRLGFLAIGDLTGAQAQVDGAPFGIDERLDLGDQTATGTSHATIVSIPFSPRQPSHWRALRWFT